MGKKWDFERIRRVAQKGYGEPLPKSYTNALSHGDGDGLAEFIVIELREAADGDPAEAARLMRRAAEQLEHVAEEFEKHHLR
jgi:hypothetical protein